MDNIVYNSIKRYFNALSVLGYKSYSDTYKLLYVISIRDFVYNDFMGMITEDDYRIIERSLYNVFGTTCLLPYPQFCKSKGMNKLHLGSVTELAHMVQHTQELFEQYKQDIGNTVNTYEQNVDNKITGLETTIDDYKTSTDKTIDTYKMELDNSEADFIQQVTDSQMEYNEAMTSIVNNYKTSTDDAILDYYNQTSTKVDEYKSQVVDDIANIKATKVMKGDSEVTEIDDIITK